MVFQFKSVIKGMFYIASFAIFTIVSSGSLFAQSNNSPVVSNVIQVSHIVDVVTLQKMGENDVLKEEDTLNVGDIINVGEASAVRLTFPDGTVQVLCENARYEVLESGDQKGDTDVVFDFSRCDIKPRFIGRCFDRSNDFLSKQVKAGQEPQVGRSDAELELKSQNKLSNEFSTRCTRGEKLFLTYSSIVPKPPVVPITVPEPGGSPTR